MKKVSSEYDFSGPKLSICIATFNREKFICETLDSILAQLEDDVELVVVDGNSTDDTLGVMTRYCKLHPEIRYYREDINSGVDKDYDKVVGYALGKYCWLMSDDDLLKSGAIKRVLSACKENFDCVIVDAEVRSVNLSKVLIKKRLKHTKDQVYKSGEFEKLFLDVASQLSFIASVIIRKDIWMTRDRKSYFGSFFVHVGVLFQEVFQGNILVIAEPQLILRYGNASWTSRAFEIWMFKWPQIIWSFDLLSDADKNEITPSEPWRNYKDLIILRAKGAYKMCEYVKYIKPLLAPNSHGLPYALIALFPGKLLNMMVYLYILIFGRAKAFTIEDLKNSDFYFLRNVNFNRVKQRLM